ncbi:hypothetical protein, partial [Streptomyces sp. NPDC093149]|uniref:hypothetical protein n=1 Tax=Streptomyces sp. NPDC093149 TaxID=3366031 RepID=UPI0037FDF789
MLVLAARPASADKSLLRKPVSWERLGDLPDTGSQWECALWRPVPPDGYVALGDIAARRDIGPEGYGGWADTMCVKKTHNGRNYVRQAECSELLYEENGWKLWSIATPPYPDGDLDEHLYLPMGCFTAVRSEGHPAPTPVTWTLDLPAIIDKRDGPEIPELTSHNRPPATIVITDRTVTVPYFMVKDDARNDRWKRDNSPFYKIERKRHYELILYRDNRNGTVEQEESQAVTTGVSEENSEAFSQNTGVTVSESVGVEVGARPFGIGAGVTVTSSVSATIETGYESRYSVSAMRQETKTRGLAIPPHSSACLWMEHHRLITRRGNGDD